MSLLDGPLVYVDIETTGISAQRHRIIEVAAIRVEAGEVTDKFSSLVDPGAGLPPFISGLTGITDNDLSGAPSFYDIAGKLYEILDGALFIAHNVRFDYGFLKREFKDVGKQFNPKLLCTVRLSRALYPELRGHRLQDIIERCELPVAGRHRAYDDAGALMLFIQHTQAHFPAPRLQAALAQQIKSPSLPKNLLPADVQKLPEATGVYIFEDEHGRPLYVGKSLNIKQRVLSHFSADHTRESEFKIAQQTANIQALVTGSELAALLLEAKLIKQLQPLHNRQLRRYQKLTLVRQSLNEQGYIKLNFEDTARIDPAITQEILGVYTTKGKAREYLGQAVKDFGLCPKLAGLENGRGSCFYYQLKKCSGACAGREPAASYNRRLLAAFERRRLQQWPYRTPVIIEDKAPEGDYKSIVVDQWCVIADIVGPDQAEAQIELQAKMFDIDTYKILRAYLATKLDNLNIKPISYEQLQALAG